MANIALFYDSRNTWFNRETKKLRQPFTREPEKYPFLSFRFHGTYMHALPLFVISSNIPTFSGMKKNIEIHLVDLSTSLPLPYADDGIRTDLPSPASTTLSSPSTTLTASMAVLYQGTGWKLKQEQLSKHYTTDIGEIIEIKCK